MSPTREAAAGLHVEILRARPFLGVARRSSLPSGLSKNFGFELHLLPPRLPGDEAASLRKLALGRDPSLLQINTKWRARAQMDATGLVMQPPFDLWLSTTVAADVAATMHMSVESLAERQQRRLAAVISSAIHRSPLYRHLLKGAGPHGLRLQDMPVVRKAELMHRFDEWCADPAIRMDTVRRFMADPANIGRPFLGRYVVWESSGGSGEPGLFVQDAAAMAVYDALEALRKPDLMPLRHLLDPWELTDRIVFIGAVGGHFASTVSIERLRLLNPLLASKLASVSFLQPTERLVSEVEEHGPTVIATYPSVAVLLANESIAGRLRISPREIWTGGETLSPSMRRHVQQAFGCPVVIATAHPSSCRSHASARMDLCI